MIFLAFSATEDPESKADIKLYTQIANGCHCLVHLSVNPELHNISFTLQAI